MTTTPPRAGCADCARTTAAAASGPRGITRRTALRAGLAGVAAAFGADLVMPRLAFAATSAPYTGDTLVVLSLRGGFDGLSAVAPVGSPDLYRLRPRIAVPQSAALPLDALFGLHPSLPGLKGLYDAGRLAVVHAAGLPQPNRSHFDAMAQIEAAAPGSAVRSGWLDRVLALHDPAGPFGAVQVGGGVPFSLLGDFPELSLWGLDSFGLSGVGDDDLAPWSAFLTSAFAHAPAGVATSARTATGALASVDALRHAQPVPDDDPVYPHTDLGRQLRDVARLVRGDVGLRVATLDYGDWDMHAGLGRADGGWMHDHLGELDAALTAFATDLGEDLSRVTLVTISEFGRRAQENESEGVDHGWGNVMFVLGGHVNGGQVFTQWPGLADDDLADGDLVATTDYRAVLADVLRHRAGASAAEVATVFPGWTGTTSGITRPS